MKMDFGVALGRALRISDVADHARVAEESGFSYMGFVDQQNLDRDVYVMMTVAALHTHRIHVGQSVTQPFTYHPSVIANATATVSELSGGRVFLGIGAGGSALRSMGRGARPMAELREAVEFIRRYMAGEEAEFKGSKMRSEWIRRPVPIYMACRGPKACELAGELADGVIFTGIHPEMVKWTLELVERGARRVGRDLSKLDIRSIAICYVAETKEKAWRESAPFAANVTRLYSLLQTESPEIADLRRRLEHAEPGIIEEFRRVHDCWDESWHERLDAPHARVVTPRINDFVNLTGTVDDICERIVRLGELGVTTIEAATYSIIDQKGMMREIGNQIMSRFRV
jgi:5,10-methylenetetrahydromethanopterin reductase